MADPATLAFDHPAGGVAYLSAAWQVPAQPIAIWVLAHGAGAQHDHVTMRSLADGAARAGIATLRFNFPFAELGKRRVDTPAVAIAAIGTALAAARVHYPGLRCFAGGHSFGGRMASHACDPEKRTLDAIDVAGLIFTSFPLHPAGRPGTARAVHLERVERPMLFLSGTRDALCEAQLLNEVVARLPSARVHWLDTADHGYKVRQRTRVRSDDVFDEIGLEARRFVESVGA